MSARRTLLLFLLIASSFLLAAAAPKGPVIHFFYGQGCPHCKKEEVFLRECERKYGNLDVRRYEVYFDEANMALFQDVAESLGATAASVPFLVIGRAYVVGFDANFTPPVIKMEIEKCLVARCPDVVWEMRWSGPRAQEPEKDGKSGGIAAARTPQNRTIPIPLLGELDVSALSLPALTAVMGFLDGFNPCAMWALVFLIGLLLGMRDRGRMWLLGTAFIVTSALVYFLFMAAWLNLILFFGLVFWVRVAIGLVALAGGAYSVRDALVNREISCSMNGDERRRQFRIRLRNVIGRHGLIMSMAGIAALAFMVNLVEIVCSAGFPAIYTQVLSLSALPRWQYYAYILLYIFFFMLDDMFVFVAAMLTLEVTGATTTYVRYARLLGGVLMLAIGALLIFRPQILMFG